MTEPICKICGHSGVNHKFADPVVCTKCPDRKCQDGPDGQRYREHAES